MLLEYKSLNVENEDEESIISLYSSFGWTVKSTQRVRDHITELTRHYDGEIQGHVYGTETEIIDFTKIVLQRDKKMENYDELVDLEQEFERLSDQLDDLEKEEAESNRLMVKHEKKCDLRSPISKAIHILGIVISALGLFVGIILQPRDISYEIAYSSLLILIFIIVNNILTKQKARKAFRNSLGEDSIYWKRYLKLREEYLKKNPDIARIVNGRDERMAEMRHIRSECKKILAQAENLL